MGKHFEKIHDCNYSIVDYLALGSRTYLGDPKQPSIFVFGLDLEGKYQYTRFQGSDRLISPTFPELDLIVDQILAA